MARAGDVGVWIWIIGGIAAGALVFMATITLLPGQVNVNKEIGSTAFREVYQDLKTFCSKGIGSRYTSGVELPEVVESIYVSPFDQEPPDKVRQYVAEGNVSTGNYTCLKFRGEVARCDRLTDCTVTMTYLGAPPKGFDILAMVSNLGKNPSYPYFLVFNKTGVNRVDIVGYRMAPGQALPVCGNNNLEVGEECENDESQCEQSYGTCSAAVCTSCLCDTKLNCDVCADEQFTNDVNSDWCSYCSRKEVIWRGRCDDGVDNDCDGKIDEEDEDCDV